MIFREKKKLGIYIHIPFCTSKCGYCGFYSSAGKSDQEHLEYCQCLLEDVTEYANVYSAAYVVDSIFIGGGTPSILNAECITEILDSIRDNFELDTSLEITIEANPKTLTKTKLQAYRKAGINRLSIGLQSFDDRMLGILGRAHTVADFEENFLAARECGFDHINIDLMFAIPEHTLDIWEETLDKAIRLAPEHISFYSLQIEEDTPFFAEFQAGTMTEIDDETDRKMYHLAIKKLKEAGYDHYEISSCAKPGYRCRHNLKYWGMEDYLGIGEGASSYMEGIRFSEAPGCEYHENAFTDNVSEFVFTGLRKAEGISFSDFKDKYGEDFWVVFSSRREKLQEFFDSGQLIEESETLRLSEEGIDVSNRIMSIFM